MKFRGWFALGFVFACMLLLIAGPALRTQPSSSHVGGAGKTTRNDSIGGVESGSGVAEAQTAATPHWSPLPGGPIYLGMWANSSNDQPNSSRHADIDAVEAKVGRTFALDLHYASWTSLQHIADWTTAGGGSCGGLGTCLDAQDDYNNNRIPVESWNCGYPSQVVVKGNTGTYWSPNNHSTDADIDAAATAIKNYSHLVIVRFFWEMTFTDANQSRTGCYDPTPYTGPTGYPSGDGAGNGSTGPNLDLYFNGQAWVNMWQHVITRMRADGVTNVLFEWAPGAGSDGSTMQLSGWYWPGSSYVDIMAFDSYDRSDAGAASELDTVPPVQAGGYWSPPLTTYQILQSFSTTLPIAWAENGIHPDTGSNSGGQWQGCAWLGKAIAASPCPLTQGVAGVLKQHPQIVSYTYFDANICASSPCPTPPPQVTNDWLINTSPAPGPDALGPTGAYTQFVNLKYLSLSPLATAPPTATPTPTTGPISAAPPSLALTWPPGTVGTITLTDPNYNGQFVVAVIPSTLATASVYKNTVTVTTTNTGSGNVVVTESGPTNPNSTAIPLVVTTPTSNPTPANQIATWNCLPLFSLYNQPVTLCGQALYGASLGLALAPTYLSFQYTNSPVQTIQIYDNTATTYSFAATPYPYIATVNLPNGPNGVITVTPNGVGPGTATWTITDGTQYASFAINIASLATSPPTAPPTSGPVSTVPQTLVFVNATAPPQTLAVSDPLYSGGFSAVAAPVGIVTTSISGTNVTVTPTSAGNAVITISELTAQPKSTTVPVTVQTPTPVPIGPVSFSSPKAVFSGATAAPQTFTINDPNYSGAFTVSPTPMGFASATVTGTGNGAILTVTPLLAASGSIYVQGLNPNNAALFPVDIQPTPAAGPPTVSPASLTFAYPQAASQTLTITSQNYNGNYSIATSAPGVVSFSNVANVYTVIPIGSGSVNLTVSNSFGQTAPPVAVTVGTPTPVPTFYPNQLCVNGTDQYNLVQDDEFTNDGGLNMTAAPHTETTQAPTPAPGLLVTPVPFVWSNQFYYGRTNNVGIDDEYYTWPQDPYFGGYNPFSGLNGQPLYITSEAIPAAYATASPLEVNPTPGPTATAGYANEHWLSGVLQGPPILNGYFEVAAEEPNLQGWWPAPLFLLDANGTSPTNVFPNGREIDPNELFGNSLPKSTIQQTLIYNYSGGPSSYPTPSSLFTRTIVAPDPSIMYHSYGVLWTPMYTQFFIDRVPSGGPYQNTSTNAMVPIIILQNFTSSAFAPPPANKLSQTMGVMYYRAWQKSGTATACSQEPNLHIAPIPVTPAPAPSPAATTVAVRQTPVAVAVKSGANNTYTLTTTPTNGDMLLAVVSGPFLSLPTGWSWAVNQSNGVSLAWGIVGSGGLTAATSYSFPNSASGSTIGQIIDVKNPGATAPIISTNNGAVQYGGPSYANSIYPASGALMFDVFADITSGSQTTNTFTITNPTAQTTTTLGSAVNQSTSGGYVSLHIDQYTTETAQGGVPFTAIGTTGYTGYSVMGGYLVQILPSGATPAPTPTPNPAPSYPPTPTPLAVPVNQAYLGAYYNEPTTQGANYNQATVQTFEAAIGRKLAIVNHYHNFTDIFPFAAATGAPPVTGTPMPYNQANTDEEDDAMQGRYSADTWNCGDNSANIINGVDDQQILQTAYRIASYQQPILVRYFHEFNLASTSDNHHACFDPRTVGSGGSGDTPLAADVTACAGWSIPVAGCDGYFNPTTWVGAWQHVYTLTKSVAPNAIFVWDPSSAALGIPASFPLYQYYPGDAYVDWAGFDVYEKRSSGISFQNTGTCAAPDPVQSPDPNALGFSNATFNCPDDIYGLVTAITGKPIYVAETAVQPPNQPAWVSPMPSALPSSFPQVKAIAYFDQSNVTYNWALTGGVTNPTPAPPNGYSAFATMGANMYMNPPMPTTSPSPMPTATAITVWAAGPVATPTGGVALVPQIASNGTTTPPPGSTVLLIANTDSALSLPSGWTQIVPQTAPGALQAAYCEVGNGCTAAASYNFGGVDGGQGQLIVLKGAATAPPVVSTNYPLSYPTNWPQPIEQLVNFSVPYPGGMTVLAYAANSPALQANPGQFFQQFPTNGTYTQLGKKVGTIGFGGTLYDLLTTVTNYDTYPYLTANDYISTNSTISTDAVGIWFPAPTATPQTPPPPTPTPGTVTVNIRAYPINNNNFLDLTTQTGGVGATGRCWVVWGQTSGQLNVNGVDQKTTCASLISNVQPIGTTFVPGGSAPPPILTWDTNDGVAPDVTNTAPPALFSQLVAQGIGAGWTFNVNKPTSTYNTYNTVNVVVGDYCGNALLTVTTVGDPSPQPIATATMNDNGTGSKNLFHIVYSTTLSTASGINVNFQTLSSNCTTGYTPSVGISWADFVPGATAAPTTIPTTGPLTLSSNTINFANPAATPTTIAYTDPNNTNPITVTVTPAPIVSATAPSNMTTGTILFTPQQVGQANVYVNDNVWPTQTVTVTVGTPVPAPVATWALPYGGLSNPTTAPFSTALPTPYSGVITVAASVQCGVTTKGSSAVGVPSGFDLDMGLCDGNANPGGGPGFHAWNAQAGAQALPANGLGLTPGQTYEIFLTQSSTTISLTYCPYLGLCNMSTVSANQFNFATGSTLYIGASGPATGGGWTRLALADIWDTQLFNTALTQAQEQIIASGMRQDPYTVTHTPGPLSISPTSLTFNTPTSPTQPVSIYETYYNSGFTLSGNNGAVATGNVVGNTLTVTPVGAGQTTFNILDNHGGSVPLLVTVNGGSTGPCDPTTLTNAESWPATCQFMLGQGATPAPFHRLLVQSTPLPTSLYDANSTTWLNQELAAGSNVPFSSGAYQYPGVPYNNGGSGGYVGGGFTAGVCTASNVNADCVKVNYVANGVGYCGTWSLPYNCNVQVPGYIPKWLVPQGGTEGDHHMEAIDCVITPGKCIDREGFSLSVLPPYTAGQNITAAAWGQWDLTCGDGWAVGGPCNLQGAPVSRLGESVTGELLRSSELTCVTCVNHSISLAEACGIQSSPTFPGQQNPLGYTCGGGTPNGIPGAQAVYWDDDCTTIAGYNTDMASKAIACALHRYGGYVDDTVSCCEALQIDAQENAQSEVNLGYGDTIGAYWAANGTSVSIAGYSNMYTAALSAQYYLNSLPPGNIWTTKFFLQHAHVLCPGANTQGNYPTHC